MFLPLYDHNRRIHVMTPVVNLSLIAANILCFVLLQSGGAVHALNASALSYGLVPSVFLDLKILPLEYQVLPDNLSVVTYAFMHGSWWHLIGNMVFLWVFGDNIEDALGHIRYLLFYLLCATAGGLAYAYTNYGSDVPLVGASGAVSGIVAAYLMLHPRVKIWVLVLGRIPLRLSAGWVLGAWVVYQVVNAVFGPEGNIAWSAHIGGLAAGCVLVIFLRRRGVPLFDQGLRTG